ncbi:hypothetical protein ASPWEDRAFT_176498 [Aspergillus wentii DTO 134E9]|uniref:ER-bound oxygenase mpaB/mpaB'/Rubber oxygenase catalytic domain-containing protein n=1 Tax=Aspergillus wentii DTO 134E9 TaxID=1073089 RepID=A0A1L9R962_ASPWE|nr:uncharacterized protein ASPWEDRAFT_176498 [Aspergillus wentii DTO 134E9]KAI9926530.1 hypothetical protein MW887_004298 [Aspergillus wentii]OJJ31423.1 hypothetical protein ASPWEDRAFT_176498 [Aspergillus wentii DTO 134E9]
MTSPKLTSNTHKVWNHTFEWTDKHFTPEELLPLRQRADDLAVNAVDRLQAIAAEQKQSNAVPCAGRFDMYATLKKHHEEDRGLQELWEEINSVPEWVDWTQIERGQLFLWRYLIPNLTGLALQGFLGGTATIAGGTEVLVRTGGFSIRVMPRRFLETFLWLLQVTMDLESIQPGGEGHTSTVRVRLLHATVRHRMLKLIDQDSAYFDEAEYGAPVNLRDSIHATAIFCCMPLFRQLPNIGIQPRPDEARDFLALFRYIAYIMATPNSYFDGVDQCKATMESIMLCEPPPTESSKLIGLNFVTAIQDFPGINVSKSMIEVGCRAMSGDEMGDEMGLSRPGMFYYASFKGWCRLLVVITALQRWIPAFERMVIRIKRSNAGQRVWGLDAKRRKQI